MYVVKILGRFGERAKSVRNCCFNFPTLTFDFLSVVHSRDIDSGVELRTDSDFVLLLSSSVAHRQRSLLQKQREKMALEISHRQKWFVLNGSTHLQDGTGYQSPTEQLGINTRFRCF